MNRKLKKNDYISIAKKFLFIAIPFVIGYIMLFNYSFNLELTKNKELVVGEQLQKSNTIIYVIQDLLKEAESDLMVIKNSDEMNKYLDESSQENLMEAENLFIRIASNKKDFDQIRYIDNDGMEIIRVINSDEGSYLVEPDLLQERLYKSCYLNTSKLKKGEVYVSAMELNKIDDAIEVPYKPVLRIATPLYNTDDEYSGVLVINYMAGDLLRIVNEQFDNSDYNFVNHYLINEEGYYLLNKDTKKIFSFMFDESYNLNVDNPLLWNEIKKHNTGKYEMDNMEFSYVSLNPLENVTSTQSEYRWFIVSEFNISDLTINEKNVIFGLELIDIIILVIMVLVILLITIVIYFKNMDKKQLNITTRIAENTNDATVITDAETRIIYINRAFEKLTGYTQEEVIGKKMNYFKSHMQDEEFYKNMWKSLKEKGSWEGELWDKKKDGLLYPRKLNIMAVKNRNGIVERYIGIFMDLTKNIDTDKLSRLEKYNLDTGLPNEKHLIELLDSQAIEQNNELTIVCLEINNYNDLISNSDLDYQEYLNQFIKEIKTEISDNDIIAQLSKSIFVIGLIDGNNKVIENIFNHNNKTVIIEGKDFMLDFKAGASTYPVDGLNTDELINNAIIALQYAKIGNEGFVYFEHEFKEEIIRKMEMNILLSKAIINDELIVYYQPQISCIKGDVIGAEALMRWDSKELGMISPNVFIPIAEKSGFIIELGYWIIEKVFKDFHTIKDEVDNSFRISVNVSPVQFRDKNLINRIVALSKKYNFNLNNFEIEITESLFLKDMEEVNSKLKEFSNLGISIAIDDFGTGFSSLSYLKNLNIDRLKIDRSFIKDYPNGDDGGMVKVITNMGRELKLDVIIEGVETKDQANYSKEVSCDSIQGYYYSKPIDLINFIHYLINKD